MLPVAWALGGPGGGVAAAVEAAGKSGAAHSEAGRLPHKRTYPPWRQSFTRPSRNYYFFYNFSIPTFEWQRSLLPVSADKWALGIWKKSQSPRSGTRWEIANFNCANLSVSTVRIVKRYLKVEVHFANFVSVLARDEQRRLSPHGPYDESLFKTGPHSERVRPRTAVYGSRTLFVGYGNGPQNGVGHANRYRETYGESGNEKDFGVGMGQSTGVDN